MKTEIKKLQKFIEKFPEAETHGFWSCGPTGDYRVVVLASVPAGNGLRRSEAAEFVGGTPEALVAAMAEAGFEPGEGVTTERVRAICESAPRSPRFRRGSR